MAWWGVNLLPLVEIFMTIHGERPLLAAVRMLPQAIASSGISIVLAIFPSLISRPRWTITVGMIACIVGYLLMTRPHDYRAYYWRFLFPGFFIGSAGNMASHG